MDVPALDWLTTSAVCPALFSWPVALAEQAAVAAARAWWRRWQREDDLETRSADVLAAVVGLPLSEADVQRLEDLLCSSELWAQPGGNQVLDRDLPTPVGIVTTPRPGEMATGRCLRMVV